MYPFTRRNTTKRCVRDCNGVRFAIINKQNKRSVSG